MHISRMEVRGRDVVVVGLNQHNLERMLRKTLILTHEEHGAVVPPGIRIILYRAKTDKVLMQKLGGILSVLIGENRHEEMVADLNLSLAHERLRTGGRKLSGRNK